jgi:magnesium chelatase subunit D
MAVPASIDVAAQAPAIAPVADARLAAQLFAIDPGFAGGIVVRASAGPVRDRWLADLRALLPEGTPWRAVPIHVDDDRLLGGIDLAATLQRGKPVAQRGLLAEADGGVLLLAMAERIGESSAAHVAAALDTGTVRCARHGIERSDAAVFGVLALDESADADADEALRETLRDRLAFHVDLRELSWRDAEAWPALPRRAEIAAARARVTQVEVGDDIVEALCAAALALGVWSMRASVQVVRAARLAAALAGRHAVTADDAALAARLVLAPRATRLPPQPAAEEEASQDEADDDVRDSEPEPEPEPGPESAKHEDPAREPPAGDEDHETRADEPLEDSVVEAAVAAIPADVLRHIAAAERGSGPRGASGRAGAARMNRRRGRPAGVRREAPRAGARLDVIATLRAAVPWQRLRGRDAARDAGSGRATPIRIRAEDFHVGRFKEHRRTTTIFAVDASGSAALHRLAEAKGAVELLLADCYVRRDSVAVFGFRGRAAELLLAPTRSLVRAKRSLAELPGGGGTPLAAGLDAAREMAQSVQRRGDSAVVVILSDGRANVARDGGPGRPRAEAEARLAAIALRQCGATTIFVDTSPQPHPLARDLAGLMGARYLFLPHAEAAALSAAVRHAAAASAAAR